MATDVFYYETDNTEHDISCDAYSVSITRGRKLELRDIGPGTAQIKVRNDDRDFDPYFQISTGELLRDTGDSVIQGGGAGALLVTTGSNATGQFGPIEIGRRIVVKDDSVIVFSGIVEDYDYHWDHMGRAVVTIEAADALTTLAAADLAEWTPNREQPGDRLNAIMDRAEVAIPSGVTYRDIDTGIAWLAPLDVRDDTNALRYAQRCALSDLGRLFASRTDVVTFRDRATTRAQAVSVAFGDGGIDIRNVGVRFGSEELHFKVSVARVGGVPRVSTNQTAIDDNPRRGARQRNLSGLFFEHDAYSRSYAEYLITRLSASFAVVSELTVILNGLTPAERADVAGIEINDVVSLSWTPTCDGAAVSQTLIVEGVQYSTSTNNRQVKMVFHLSATDDTSYWTVEDAPPLGTIDLSGVVLAY